MSIFEHADFDDHEQVEFCRDPDIGLRAIIAIHNTNRGPALGGCRMWPYPSEAEALTDVLRLSRGMTYKSALANLDLGGGKAVILGDPRQGKSKALLRAFGRFVDGLGGRYITAEDSGTGVEDLRIIATESEHVVGIVDKPTGDGGRRSGDPSPSTAYGVFIGMTAAAKHRFGSADLFGAKVAVQGVGNVGFRLARYLREAGADVWVTDVDEAALERAARELGATPVTPDRIFGLPVDILAPCALGGAISDETRRVLRAGVVAGAANNQLADSTQGPALKEQGVLYAPDYAINAGGVIDAAYERGGFDRDAMFECITGIYDTLREIFERSDREGLPTDRIADRLAEERWQRAAPPPAPRPAAETVGAHLASHAPA